jgi:hypothetical protein
MSGPGPLAEINHPVDKRPDPEAISEQPGQHHTGVRDRSLVTNTTLVASGRPFTMVVTSWCRPAVARHDSFRPAQEVI